jgi:type 1 glutamine amidotransferase
VSAILLALLAQADTVAGQPYVKLETREATRQHMIARLDPGQGEWGSWWLCSCFPYAGHGRGDLATPFAPELELARLAAGGAGPDLTLVHRGKKGSEARWRELGRIYGERIDLHGHGDEELDDLAQCYLWTTVTMPRAGRVEVDCGSDDGMRFWLNGRLIVDRDVPRGLNPLDEHLALDLEAGTNHVLVKVCEGFGSWDFQINSKKELEPAADSQLQFLLDRDFPPSEERRHYQVVTVPVPKSLVLEVGGLDFFPDRTPVVTTRRGDVLRVLDAQGLPPVEARFELFASGLHEPLGASVRIEAAGTPAVYTVQRGELTRLVDEDGDARADLYEAVSAGWGLSGNYHEFAFGPKFDHEGNAWLTLNVGFCGGLGKSIVPYRGWAVKITPAGELVPVCDGMRSPNGMGGLPGGPMFYVDNQGDYVCTNRLSELRRGSWHGHPASLRWRKDLQGPDQRPPRMPPTVWFPYDKMGRSAADIEPDETGGRFGPFGGQLFVGDQFAASVMRVSLERVRGHWQGACHPFLEDLDCGVNRLAFAPDGSLWVGETDRGWTAVGRKSYGLQRIVYTGVEPFEILRMRSRPDGFALDFTQPVDPTSAQDPRSYRMSSYTYEYHSDYGAPEIETQPLTIREARLVDSRTVELVVDPLRTPFVHELHAPGLRSQAGAPLLHEEAYYTLVNVQSDARNVVAHRLDLPRALFLTASQAYEHDVVKRPDEFVLSPADERLTEATSGIYDLTCTKDCSLVDAAYLADFDLVVFQTQGDIPIRAQGKADLLEWIRAGGAFVAIHCGSDTLYDFPPYQEMVGGVFDGHPWHQEIGVRVEDARFPATAFLAPSFRIADEIYQFKQFRRHPVRVLLSLDPASVDVSLGKREDGDYALAWLRDWGQGRVFFTALGHRESVWRDARFVRHLLEGMKWALAGPDYGAPVPKGAVSLFDGSSLEAWRHVDGRAAGWKLVDGAAEVAAGTGDIASRAQFGDALVHVEFQVPDMPDASGQGKGNSGVYVQGRYEVQVLDSFGLEPGEGDCGAIYGQRVPDVNACRPPGRWQAYDIEFSAPRFDPAGRKTASARMSVWHNGIPIHRDVEVAGPTRASLGDDESPTGPLLLQDHGNAVRYRNVWVLPRR